MVSSGFRFNRKIGKHVRHQRLVDKLLLKCDAVSRMVDRLGNRLSHQGRRAYAAIEPRVVAHLNDRRNSAPLLADELSVGAMKLGLARGVRTIAELVF